MKSLGGTFWWRKSENMNTYLSDEAGLTLDTGLEDALSAEHEILFSSFFTQKDVSILSKSQSNIPEEQLVNGILLYLSISLSLSLSVHIYL